MKYLTLLISLYLLFFATSSIAEIYKWTDENGRVHFGDNSSRPAEKTVKSLDIKINSYQSQEQGVESPKLVMYSTSWCGYCKNARKYFKENGIAFVDYDIEKDSSANKRHKELGGRGVPLIVYKGKTMSGFSEGGFKRKFGIKPK